MIAVAVRVSSIATDQAASGFNIVVEIAVTDGASGDVQLGLLVQVPFALTQTQANDAIKQAVVDDLTGRGYTLTANDIWVPLGVV